MRNKWIPFFLPSIGNDEKKAVLEVLESGWLTTGPKVKQFEQEFAKYIGARHAIAVNSGTAALHLALDAVGIKEGDEVIVPTMTFAATGEVVHYLKARPVLVDCEFGTFNMDPKDVERKITIKTKAIIPVHFGGEPCDMDRISEIAGHHNLKVIEDAAHALPAKHREKMVGTIGDITAFSFYATKNITTGEGGMITTDNDDYAERMRIMSLHGISEDAWKRYTAEGSWDYEILYPGFKYNMTDIAAAIGIQQLLKCDRFWETRKYYAELYDKGFEGVPEITTPALANGRQHAWHLYVIQLNLERLRIARNAFVELLKKENIGTSVHFIPLHLHPYYRESFGYKPEDFPNASSIYERIISLPLYPKMTEEDVNDVIEAVKKVVHVSRK